MLVSDSRHSPPISAKSIAIIGEPDMILTLRELANYLRVNERTIQRMLKSGQIQGVKIGGQWRFNGSQIDRVFFPDKPVTDSDAVPLSELVQSHLAIPVSRMVREDRVILDMQAGDAAEAIEELSQPFSQQTLLLDAQDLRNRLLAREKLLSTGIGNGLALPHPRDPIPTLREPSVIVLGRSARGIDFNAVDGKPVHLFFLLCSQNIELHLHMMGRLAQILRDQELPAACLRAGSATDITRLIMEAERRQFLGHAGTPAQAS